MRHFVFALSCLLAGYLSAIPFASADEGADLGIELRQDVVYGNAADVELMLHLALPKGSRDTRRPGVVFLHRGGWVSGSKDHYLSVIQEFASHGYVAASVGYRFAPKYQFPAQVEDAKCAVRWMRANAAELGVDPDRIGAIGESAGAHLAMMLGTLDPEDGLEGDGGWQDQSSKVQVVVSFYGPVDLRWDELNDSPYIERFDEAVARRLLTRFVGGKPEEKRDLLYKASPIKYVDHRDAPTLLLQGTADPLVLPDQAIKMADALTAAGIEGRAEFIFGKVHDWDGDDFSQPLVRARRFLDQHLKKGHPESDDLSQRATNQSWNKELAANRLDARAGQWNDWERSQRSHETTCISCHTGLPYLLARANLGRAIGESESPTALDQLLDDVRTRVKNRDDVEPWYTSSERKSAESIGTEAVISALVLCIQDAESNQRRLSDTTRQALDWMWSQQNGSGDHQGAWPWLNFKLEPWESESATFWGAALAAVAVGIAPENYADDAEVAGNVAALKSYLQRNLADQSLHHRAVALMASTRLPRLIDHSQQQSIAEDILGSQRRDGSWSLDQLGTWRRSNDSSDAYATGLMVYTLSQFRSPEYRDAISRGRNWLIENQHAETGGWMASSVNKERAEDSFVGMFMQDAATAYAVLALLASE